MIKRILINLLFRLLGPISTHEYQDIDDKHIDNWLDRQFKDPGFRDYIRKRDLTLLKSMGTFLPREDYAIQCGQRLEMMTLLQAVHTTHERLEKERKALIEQAERSKNQNKK
jgi:hypothetical protein